ncbi:HAD family hydrolase [Intrasporangium sp. DVR]|uniref:HAD family hydrolase n=1 Tax=Intrasporangium sp. DVR TaxID=3127867 RepID=UPI00313A5FCF
MSTGRGTGRDTGRGTDRDTGRGTDRDTGRDTDRSPRADDLLTTLRRHAQDLGGSTPRAAAARGLVPAPPAPLLRPRLFVALALATPVVALALLAGGDTGARWVQVVLTAAVLGWCARPLVEPAWAGVRHLRPNPDVPVLLAATVSWVHSVAALLRDAPDEWSGTPAVVTALLLLVRYVEARIREAAGPDAPTPAAAGRLETWFTPVVVLTALALLVVRLLSGQSLTSSLVAVVAVLVIASFPALALAAPAALAAARGRTARSADPPPGSDLLPAAGLVDTVVITRTGVLTTGDLSLTSIAVTGRLSKKAALTAAAAVEQGSSHPVARAIVAGAELARIDLPRIRDFEANQGEGASARIKDTEVTVGKAALFEEVDEALVAHADQTPGRTVYVGWSGRARAALTVEDAVRDTSRAAVARLKELGLATYLLSDEGEAHARGVAAAVGIDPGKVRSRARDGAPDLVSELQRQGRRVAVVGHPRPGLLFDRDDLDRVADTVELAQRTRAVIRQNVVWALAYDAVALVAGALGLVHPVLAAVLATLAAGVPLLNAHRLTR